MGWLLAIIVLPLLFAVGATIAVFKLTFLLLRLLFLPALMLRRR
jgi:hypothetical protein